jgi:2-dehydro-3-deoxy-D-arabinonate dehydratase
MTTIFRTQTDFIIAVDGQQYQTTDFSFDELFTASDPSLWLRAKLAGCQPAAPRDPGATPWLAPIGSQEVWAAGVTYFRSRTARMEEAEAAGGDIFYDKVYEAERPELFFKATPTRTRGHLAPIRIRTDSTWDVPEPELTLAINSHGRVFGYTIGNDVSSRSIEGENPLYLPQAKVYRGSCALGPGLVVGGAVTPQTAIRLRIFRDHALAFSGETSVSQIKRGFDELAGFLFRDNEFPQGAYLLTGTGIVPDNSFSLRSGDRVAISIDGLGELVNTVE